MESGFLVIVVSVLWVGSEIILARTKHSASTGVSHDKNSLRVLWITIAIAVNLGVVLGLQPIGYIGFGTKLLPPLGLILIVGGLLLRWIAIFSLKRQFTVDVSIAEGHHIIRTGIYRTIRHPAYAGSLLSFLGLGLCFSNYLSVVVVFVPVCLAFLYRIRVEERVLTDAFGAEYAEYCSSTKRLIPGVF